MRGSASGKLGGGHRAAGVCGLSTHAARRRRVGERTGAGWWVFGPPDMGRADTRAPAGPSGGGATRRVKRSRRPEWAEWETRPRGVKRHGWHGASVAWAQNSYGWQFTRVRHLPFSRVARCARPSKPSRGPCSAAQLSPAPLSLSRPAELKPDRVGLHAHGSRRRSHPAPVLSGLSPTTACCPPPGGA